MTQTATQQPPHPPPTLATVADVMRPPLTTADTNDKPGVSLGTPAEPGFTSGFLNVRAADIARIYEEWSGKGAEFLTKPKDHGREIRAYLRDPDGHLIEVGQLTRLLD